MSDPTNTTEYEELTIDTIEGLQAFLKNAQAQYNIGLEQEAEGVVLNGDKLDKAFQSVRSLVRSLITKVQAGQVVTTSDAGELQSKYDVFVKVIHEKQIPEKPAESKLPVVDELQELEEKVIPVVSEVPIERIKEDFSPRSGKLAITSDDQAVIDVKERVSVPAIGQTSEESPKKKKKRRKRKKKSNSSESTTQDAAVEQRQDIPSEGTQKLRAVVTQSRERYEKIKSKYPKLSLTQEMLLEEAKEGIEHLEILSKKQNITKEQLIASAEIASHIQNALLATDDAAVIDIPTEPVKATDVPVIVSETKNTKSPEEFVSFIPTSVTVASKNAVKRSVPKTLSSLPRPDDIHSKESLTETYLVAPKYRQFILDNYSSVKSFEQILDATVTKMEASTIDHIERWLGDLPASAFHYIKDMTLLELAKFSDQGYDKIKAVLKEENVKYETFVLWQDLIDEMVQVIPAQPTMKFAQLFTLWMAEIAMQDGE